MWFLCSEVPVTFAAHLCLLLGVDTICGGGVMFSNKYKMRETFEGENVCGSLGSERFAEKTFAEC